MNDRTRTDGDLTERLFYEREWSHQIVNHSTDMIFAFDNDLRIRVWNTQAERVTEMARDEAWGRSVSDIPPLGTLTGPEPLYRRVLGGESLRLANRTFMIRAFSVEAVVDVLLTPLRHPSGEVAGGLCIIHDITRYRRAEEGLRESEARLREAQRLAHVGSWEWDKGRDELHWSDEMYRIAGREPRSGMTVASATALIHALDRPRVHASVQHVLEGGGPRTDEFRIVCPDGSERVVESRTAAVRAPDGSLSGMLGTWLDITERKRAEESRAREREFRTLAENSTDAIARYDRALRPIYVNPAMAANVGRPRSELLGKSDQVAPPGSPLAALAKEVAKVIATGEPRVCEAARVTVEGRRWVDSHLVPEFDAAGKVETVLVVERDITELKRAQQALQLQTLVDPLTGIPNRRYLAQFMDREWRKEARHRHNVALVMIDIDYFKRYNDRYGHQQGDECLRRVATALRQTLHRPADTPVRYGGEEFAVLLPETGLAAAGDIAERLRHAVCELGIPHAASPVADRVTISLGVAAVPADVDDFDTLMARADSALYQAKAHGRNRVENAGA